MSNQVPSIPIVSIQSVISPFSSQFYLHVTSKTETSWTGWCQPQLLNVANLTVKKYQLVVAVSTPLKNISQLGLFKGSWEAILPCYGQIEFCDLKWCRVVDHITIHNITKQKNKKQWNWLWWRVLIMTGGDEGKWWRREVVTKGSGDDGKWWRREVVTMGSGDEGKWWRRKVMMKGSGEEGKWWGREAVTMGSGEEGKWWGREVVTKGSGDDGKWWRREVVKKGSDDEGEWWGREVVRKGSGDDGKWWGREVVRNGSGDEGEWWRREVVRKGSWSTKPCVFPCKVAAGDDERYLVCATGAAAVVPDAIGSFYVFCNKCLFLCA